MDSKRIKVTAIIFLGLLMLLFAANVFISIPLSRAVDASKIDIANFQVDHKYYRLSAEDYSINNSLDTIHIRSSVLPLISHQYTYFDVSVDQGAGDTFNMVVRATGKEREALLHGDAVDLYGMISNYEEPSAISLNDNGETVLGRWVKTAAFAFLSLTCFYFITKIVTK